MSNDRVRIGGQQCQRIFTAAQVSSMLKEVLEVVEELDPPADLRRDVFSVAQQMLSNYEPIQGAVTVPKMAVPRG